MLAVASLVFAACPAAAAAGPVMRFAERQLAFTHAELAPGSYPSHTRRSGRWQPTGPRAWTSGFLSGAMWLVYERTGDPIWRRRGRGANRRWTTGYCRRRTTTWASWLCPPMQGVGG